MPSVKSRVHKIREINNMKSSLKSLSSIHYNFFNFYPNEACLMSNYSGQTEEFSGNKTITMNGKLTHIFAKKKKTLKMCSIPYDHASPVTDCQNSGNITSW